MVTLLSSLAFHNCLLSTVLWLRVTKWWRAIVCCILCCGYWCERRRATQCICVWDYVTISFCVFWKKWTLDWFFFFIRSIDSWGGLRSSTMNSLSLSECSLSLIALQMLQQSSFRRLAPPIWNASPLLSCRIGGNNCCPTPRCQDGRCSCLYSVSRQRNLCQSLLLSVAEAAGRKEKKKN